MQLEKSEFLIEIFIHRVAYLQLMLIILFCQSLMIDLLQTLLLGAGYLRVDILLDEILALVFKWVISQLFLFVMFI